MTSPAGTDNREDFVRRFARFRVSAPVIIQLADEPPSLGMTSNAAIGGCCLVVSDARTWPVGASLLLTFEDDQIVRGTIRWSRESMIAVSFEQPFDELMLDDRAVAVRITAQDIEAVGDEVAA